MEIHILLWCQDVMESKILLNTSKCNLILSAILKLYIQEGRLPENITMSKRIRYLFDIYLLLSRDL